MFLSDYYSQSNEIVPEALKFLGGVALTFLMPTLFYCAVSGQLWPLYLMACNEMSGAIAGYLLFKNSSDDFVSCFPVTRVPNVPSGTNTIGLKKAA
jgi:hypothetical protein